MAAFPNRNNAQLSELPLFHRFIATGFFSGYSPFAPGTAGSAAALVFLLIPGFAQTSVLLSASFVMFVLGGVAAGKAEQLLGQDPSAVTVDEVVGMWISLMFVPLNVYTVIGAFLIFRIFDIVKPYPARYFDRKDGGWNIMLDDVVAAVYANIVMQIAVRIF